MPGLSTAHGATKVRETVSKIFIIWSVITNLGDRLRIIFRSRRMVHVIFGIALILKLIFDSNSSKTTTFLKSLVKCISNYT